MQALLPATLKALIAVVVASTGPLAAQTANLPGVPRAEVFVPSFWDPQAPIQKPDLANVGSIRFLTEDDYPPFGFTLPDGSLAGLNVDLARAICAELKVGCTVQARRWDTLVPALRAGAGDAAIASMAITEAGLRDVDFTGPYYRTPARFAARSDSHFGAILPATVGGKRVGVEAGTAHEAYLRDFFPKASIQAFADGAQVRAALRSGTVDLAFGDGIALARWLNGGDASACCGFVGGAFTESRFFGAGAGIAVKKGNAKLRATLDYALAKLAADGAYADLYLKYFPIGIY